MNGTIYIYFEGFEIGIGLHYLTDKDEHVENDVLFKRALKYLDEKSIPYRDFAGYENLVYEILM
jgi:hypothetical protein